MPKKINDWVTQALLVTAAILAFLLCFLVVADVIGRVIFNSPVKGTPEIVSSSIVVICSTRFATLFAPSNSRAITTKPAACGFSPS